MSYIRDPIYMYQEENGGVFCAECNEYVGFSDNDAYEHMAWHIKKYNKEHKFTEAEAVKGILMTHLMWKDEKFRERYMVIEKKYGI